VGTVPLQVLARAIGTGTCQPAAHGRASAACPVVRLQEYRATDIIAPHGMSSCHSLPQAARCAAVISLMWLRLAQMGLRTKPSLGGGKAADGE
jgi:hypothetical protein